MSRHHISSDALFHLFQSGIFVCHQKKLNKKKQNTLDKQISQKVQPLLTL